MEPKVYIKERTMIERLFNRAPKAELASGKPVMYKDRYLSFSTTFLAGMEFDFLMLDALIISLINSAAYSATAVNSTVLFGILLAYIIDEGFIWMRAYYGRRNLSKHTLVDEAFLI
jgi:hypothetical protein